MIRRFITVATIWFLLGSVCSAEPFIDRAWPPVLQRGQTTRVEFSGSQLDRPRGVWSSVPGVALTGLPTGMATEDTVTVDVTIPAEAPLGLYGLRLATDSGLSNVHLFLIEELTPALVQRALADDVLAVPLPACVAAPVRKARVDRYAIQVTTGQRVAFEVIGNRLGKSFDPVVTIRDDRGKFVARCDNSVGLVFDCRFAHTFAVAGRYQVEVTDARYAGEPNWSYVLRMGEFPAVQTVVPSVVAPGQEVELSSPQLAGALFPARSPAGIESGRYFQELRLAPGKPGTWVPVTVSRRQIIVEQEPNDQSTTAQHVASPMSLSAELCGVLDHPGDEDWFQFPLAKGQVVRVRSETLSIGSAADLEIILYEPANHPLGLQEVVRNDETTTPDQPRNSTFVEEANLSFGARNDGLHRLLVRDLTGAGSPIHTYRVELGENLPELKLRADVSEISLPRGTWQPVPLTITRTGFNGPVELELSGAPAGVRLEPTVIPEDAKDFVCRLSAEPDCIESLATLQIIGRALVNDRRVEAVVTVHPLIDRQLMNKDRILYALRPDQRELPPSLTNRLALQITAPVPFDFELPVQQVMMPKYQVAPLPIDTKRLPEFSGPIVFSARGGQIGDEREERVQVYFNAPPAEAGARTVVGTFANRILTQYQKHRVDIKATATVDGRQVNLLRTFQLEIRPAFEPKFEPAEIELLPGEKGLVRLTANRVTTFDGEVHLAALNHPVRLAPENLSVAKGQTETPFEVSVKPDLPPGRYVFQYDATAYVGKFQESIRSGTLTITVKKPEVKK